MGVMACSRRGCENIMCHDYSKVTGYICWECKVELEEQYHPNVESVEAFMDTEKVITQYNDEDGEFSVAKMFGEEE